MGLADLNAKAGRVCPLRRMKKGQNGQAWGIGVSASIRLERETGFEPATLSLEG